MKKIQHNFHSHTSLKLPTNKGASSSHVVCCHSPSFTDHSWLKECSGKRGTRDRRSEALIQTRLCAVLLCSPHQEWDSLWWISTKRFGTYKERQFSQVCYFKPGNLGIQLAHRGSQGSLQFLSGKLRPDGYTRIKGPGVIKLISNQWSQYSRESRRMPLTYWILCWSKMVNGLYTNACVLSDGV